MRDESSPVTQTQSGGRVKSRYSKLGTSQVQLLRLRVGDESSPGTQSEGRVKSSYSDSEWGTS